MAFVSRASGVKIDQTREDMYKEGKKSMKSMCMLKRKSQRRIFTILLELGNTRCRSKSFGRRHCDRSVRNEAFYAVVSEDRATGR